MTVRDLWQDMVRLVMVEKIDLDMEVMVSGIHEYYPLDMIVINTTHRRTTLDLEAE